MHFKTFMTLVTLILMRISQYNLIITSNLQNYPNLLPSIRIKRNIAFVKKLCNFVRGETSAWDIDKDNFICPNLKVQVDLYNLSVQYCDLKRKTTYLTLLLVLVM
jgi:hypothetical protein